MLFERNLFTRSVSGNIWEVFRIALPLILANAGHSINLFTDRLMLQKFSESAMSAAFPAGLTHFTLICYFVGTVGYANSFVAQYFGAKMYHRVGAAVWQAIYMAILGGLFSVAAYFYAPALFRAFGHEAHLIELEISYFRIMALGGCIPLFTIALSTFWGGQGKTSMVMFVNLLITACNIPFNYVLIFGWDAGWFKIPALGINGAAYGTLAAELAGVLFMVFCLLGSRTNIARFRVWNMRLDKDMFLRLFKFGGPNGIQLFLDLASFNLFVILLGRIGPDVLNASGVAFSLNSLAMIPMFGLGQTVSILVGQGIGAQDIPLAERSVRSARLWLYFMLIIIGVLFLFHPEPALTLFDLQPGTKAFDLAKIMLRFVTAYLIFDGTGILYGSAIKGAGDTKFSMWIGASFAWIIFGIPCLMVYYIFTRPGIRESLGADRADMCNLWTLWSIIVGYIMILGSTFYLRYLGGKWKGMKVIESEANDHPRGAIPKEVGVDTYLP
ncbi:MAG: MATE family efflux transporter [Lentisphaeria bacterium]|nr:MATE family efflux transporter [Lentisphaeria bacterium]